MGGIISRTKKVPVPPDSDCPEIPPETTTLALVDQDSLSVQSAPSIASIASKKREKVLDVEKLNVVKKSSANKSTAEGREANRKFQRKLYLKERGAKLRGRLKDRPTDQRALQEYGAILYEEENYMTAPKVIRRILASGDVSGDWYLKLGKCYFRRWARLGNVAELSDALECYKIAMQDPVMQRNPVHYFEVAAILLRLGRHQACLDTFGTLMSLFKHEPDWVAVAHYNISLVMMQRRNYNECMQLINDLNVSSLNISVERGKDSLFHLPYKIDNISINLETATIHECMGHKTLARNLFFESWEIVSKYRLPGNTMSFDYQLGCSSFQEWYRSASTFRRLGDMFRSLSNCIMAAEMYRMAAERELGLSTLHDVFDLSREEWRGQPAERQEGFLECLLLRAECLAEVAEYEDAERYAGFIFQKRKKDVHLCGRAAKCCRRGGRGGRGRHLHSASSALIRELQAGADRMERGILLVQSRYRIRLAQVEKHNLKYGIRAGFVVTSFLKMLLVRNRMVEKRLSGCPTRHINALVKSFLEGRISIMKSGSEALLAYIELWYLAATTVQHCVARWFARRRFGKFFKGIRGLERIFRGQMARKRLRKFFSTVQAKLDANPSVSERREESRLSATMRIPYERIDRLCSGTTCVSSEERVAGATMLGAEESPLRQKTRKERRRRIDPATGLLEDVSSASTFNPLVSHSNNGFMHSHSRSRDRSSFSQSMGRLRQVDGEGQLAVQEGSALHSSTVSATQLPQINSFNFASSTASSSARTAPSQSGGSSRNVSSGRAPLGHTAHPEPPAPKVTSDAIRDFAARHPDEDIISFVSFLSVRGDPSKQWIPFGILPAGEIVRLVQCTVLVLCSPSFSMQDCKRMTHVIKTQALDSWLRLKSLFVGGTRVGMSGLRDLLALGVSHMQSLTFSDTKMSHFFGEYLGEQLISAELVKRIKNNSKLPQTIDLKTNIKLKKLYIENELLFGDRGFNALLKCLQVNTSLEILIVRNCNVTNRGAQSCARYIGVSNTIEIINITDNLLDHEGYLSVITAVASRGFRGSLRKVHMTGQTPGYGTHNTLVELYQRGSELGVTVESEQLSARELTSMEQMRVRDTDREDIAHMQGVFRQILDDDRLQDEQLLANSFKKIIYL